MNKNCLHFFLNEIKFKKHIFLAFAHDPEHRHLESFGVLGKLFEFINYNLLQNELIFSHLKIHSLGESATAIRDPG